MKHLKYIIFLMAFLYAGIGNEAVAKEGGWKIHEHSRERLVAVSRSDGGYWVGLEVGLEPGWHTYWRTPGDNGAPLTVNWHTPGVTVDTLQFPVPKRKEVIIEGLPPAYDYIYTNSVLFIAAAKAENPGEPLHLEAQVFYTVCAELCVPVQDSLTLDVPIGDNDSVIQEKISALQNKLPVVLSHISPSRFEISNPLWTRVSTKEGMLQFDGSPAFADVEDIFVEGLPNAQFRTPLREVRADGKFRIRIPVTFYIEPKEAVKTMAATLTIASEKGSETLPVVFQKGETGKNSSSEGPLPLPTLSLMVAVLYALVGGFILNLMPCVLPVLSIKLLSLVKHAGEKDSHPRRSMCYVSMGIICSFVVIALATLVLQAAGRAIGWGIQFQEPGFILFLAIIVYGFGMVLIGAIPLTLSSPLMTKLVELTGSKRLAGMQDFFAGASATLLATPCTAPFLGVAVGVALTQGAASIFLLFIMMGIGMSFPYLLVALFPKIVCFLPRPGIWMVHVKQVLGALLLLTAAWLLWVLRYQAGLLPAIIALILMLLLHGVIHLKWWKGKELLLCVILFLLFYLPLRLPEQIAGQFLPKAGENEQVGKEWQAYSAELLEHSLANGRTVLVDVTAAWCTTCKFNKLVVLENEKTKELLHKGQVVLLVADMTSPSPLVSEYLRQMGHYGIPLNVVYGPGIPQGAVLPTLLTYGSLKEALERAGK